MKAEICIPLGENLPSGRYKATIEGIWNGDSWIADQPTFVREQQLPSEPGISKKEFMPEEWHWILLVVACIFAYGFGKNHIESIKSPKREVYDADD